MTIREILRMGDERLRRVAEPVQAFGTAKLQLLLQDMRETMVAANGDIYHGFWYPVIVAAATCVIGLIFLPETFRRNIDE